MPHARNRAESDSAQALGTVRRGALQLVARLGLRRPLDILATFGQLDGARSRLAFLRLRLNRRLPSRFRLGSEPIALRAKELHGLEIFVRPGTTDAENIFYDYVGGFHLPPAELVEEGLTAVCEVGCNAGVALASYAIRYPRAQILGVEPGAANAALARRNVARFGSRCRVVEAAVWDRETEVTIDGATDYSLAARPREAGDAIPPVAALTLDELFSRYLPDREIDFLHLSMEGGEPRALAGEPRWPRRVRAIRVEVQAEQGFPLEDALARVRALGYRARFEPFQLGGCVLGLRASSA